MASSPPAGDRARLWLTWTGVLPLGIFLPLHLAINARVLRGESAFASFVSTLERSTAVALLEWLCVLLPLLAHAAIGAWFLVRRVALHGPGSRAASVGPAMRVTGAVTLAFLVAHLPRLHFGAPGWAGEAGRMTTVLEADLSSTAFGVPWNGVVYLVGGACVAFHLGAGLWSVVVSSRLGASARARLWSAWAATAIAVALWTAMASIVVFYATGSNVLGPTLSAAPLAPCPESGK